MNAGEAKNIVVVGAGLMGHGIGQSFAQAGHRVVFHDISAENLRQATEMIRRNLQELSDLGLISEHEVPSIMDRIHTTTAFNETVADADLVIEAVFEDLKAKQSIFRQLSDNCPKRTILASNTSSLMPSTLASVTDCPDRVLVAHYFYPPHLLPLVEIVRSEFTSDATVEAVYNLVKTTGKKPVIAQKEAPGFIANRLQVALFREAFHIVEQGIASAQDVDTAVKNSFGRRLAIAGPFETLEIQDGWDVVLQILQYMLHDLNSTTEPSPLLKEKVERCELGAKTGKGFYEWTSESTEAWRKNMAEALIRVARGNSE